MCEQVAIGLVSETCTPIEKSTIPRVLLTLFSSPGLESTPTEENQYGNTDRFSFVDGVQKDNEFFKVPYHFPWSSFQPNDSGNDDDCVEYVV